MADSPLITTAAAADLLGVSTSTVKRWVDEGRLPAWKTPGGHRKIALRDVDCLKRTEVLLTDPPPIADPGREPDPGCMDLLRQAMNRGDDRGAAALLEALHRRGIGVAELADQLVAPTLAQVGLDWAQGRVDVFHEHQATQVCLAALHHLRQFLPAQPTADQPLAVGGCPEGDHYQVPTLLCEMVLREAGWRTVHIGPNTPFASFHKALVDLRPRLLWLSLSYLPDAESFLQGYRALYQAADQHGVFVAVGGRALTESLRQRMLYTTIGGGLLQFAAFARSLRTAC